MLCRGVVIAGRLLKQGCFCDSEVIQERRETEGVKVEVAILAMLQYFWLFVTEERERET